MYVDNKNIPLFIYLFDTNTKTNFLVCCLFRVEKPVNN